jgi:hypothetical protein
MVIPGTSAQELARVAAASAASAAVGWAMCIRNNVLLTYLPDLLLTLVWQSAFPRIPYLKYLPFRTAFCPHAAYITDIHTHMANITHINQIWENELIGLLESYLATLFAWKALHGGRCWLLHLTSRPCLLPS